MLEIIQYEEAEADAQWRLHAITSELVPFCSQHWMCFGSVNNVLHLYGKVYSSSGGTKRQFGFISSLLHFPNRFSGGDV